LNDVSPLVESVRMVGSCTADVTVTDFLVELFSMIDAVEMGSAVIKKTLTSPFSLVHLFAHQAVKSIVKILGLGFPVEEVLDSQALHE